MPIFEVEKDGQTFELDAPDMQAAAQALSTYTGTKPEQPASVTGFLSNAARDAGDVIGGLGYAIAHPIATGQAIAENPYGLVEPFVEMGKDPLGYAYEKPISSLLNVSSVTGVGGALGSATRVGGRAGRIAAGASTLSRAIDPFVLATKAAGGLYKGAKRGAQIMGGGMSATYGGPRQLAEAGYESAYSGKNPVSRAMRAAGVEADAQPGKEALKPPEGGLFKGYQEGRAAIRATINPELRADLAPILADKTPVTLTRIKDVLKQERSKAFYAGHDKSGAAAKVWREIDDVLAKWEQPANLPALLTAPRGAKAVNLVGKQAVEDIAPHYHGPGHPLDMGPRDYLKAWAEAHRTMEGLDQLKQELAGIHQGYRTGTARDPRAASVASAVVNRVTDEIEHITQSRGLPSYKAAMERTSAKRKMLDEMAKTFGRSEDTVTRRLASAIRDTSFTNYRERVKFIKILQDSGAPSAKHLLKQSAGTLMRGMYPRGLLGMASAAGIGTLAVVFQNPLALAVAIAHAPRMMGLAAYTGGKIEGLVMKPLLAVEKAMNRIVPTRAVGQISGRAGMVALENDKERKLVRRTVEQQARTMGYKLHARVLDKLVEQITSDDPETYIKGLNTLGKNKRLMQLIEALGKGE